MWQLKLGSLQCRELRGLGLDVRGSREVRGRNGQRISGLNPALQMLNIRTRRESAGSWSVEWLRSR